MPMGSGIRPGSAFTQTNIQRIRATAAIERPALVIVRLIDALTILNTPIANSMYSCQLRQRIVGVADFDLVRTLWHEPDHRAYQCQSTWLISCSSTSILDLVAQLVSTKSLLLKLLYNSLFSRVSMVASRLGAYFDRTFSYSSMRQ